MNRVEPAVAAIVTGAIRVDADVMGLIRMQIGVQKGSR